MGSILSPHKKNRPVLYIYSSIRSLTGMSCSIVKLLMYRQMILNGYKTRHNYIIIPWEFKRNCQAYRWAQTVQQSSRSKNSRARESNRDSGVISFRLSSRVHYFPLAMSQSSETSGPNFFFLCYKNSKRVWNVVPLGIGIWIMCNSLGRAERGHQPRIS